jgi:hypothetical protein
LKTTQSKQSPNSQKFVKSGHAGETVSACVQQSVQLSIVNLRSKISAEAVVIYVDEFLCFLVPQEISVFHHNKTPEAIAWVLGSGRHRRDSNAYRRVERLFQRVRFFLLAVSPAQSLVSCRPF